MTEIETLAIKIYQKDGFSMAMWLKDRDDVRERYRKRAVDELKWRMTWRGV